MDMLQLNFHFCFNFLNQFNFSKRRRGLTNKHGEIYRDCLQGLVEMNVLLELQSQKSSHSNLEVF